MLTLNPNLKQRADYTHKYNVLSGRHGWFRLTPAYSLKIVEEIFARTERKRLVLDPFSGTATTGLSAAYHGHSAVCVEINPFLVWLGQTKLARYSTEDVAAFERLAQSCGRRALKSRNGPHSYPPIHNIARWWSSSAVQYLSALKSNIDLVEPDDGLVSNLLKVAFCRTLIKVSNAAFNHQSMSFKDTAQADLLGGLDDKNLFLATFTKDAEFIAGSAPDNPAGSARLVHGDSRELRSVLTDKFDLVITSPPYPNRMSYIRELRPYMYWLEFLSNGRDAGDLDWKKIGGTWGVATSRLAEWQPDRMAYRPKYLKRAIDAVTSDSNKSGALLGKYIAKYFEDIWRHLTELPKVLKRNADIHYIVGNSTFYGILISVERVYADMFSELGFQNVLIRPIRKRNSKKELVEFEITATWPNSISR